MKKLLLILAAVLLASNAWGFNYQPFTFDTQLGDSYDVSQSFGVTGDSAIFVELGQYAGNQVGTFTENASFAFPGYASGTGYQFISDGYDFTATFEAQGNLYQSGGEQWFEFTGGSLKMYLHEFNDGTNVDYNDIGEGADDGSFMGADDGINIATWTLTGGGGGLTTLFAPDDGIISAYFDAQEIMAGYLFDQNGKDMSLYDIESGATTLTLGYAHVTTEDYTPPSVPDPFAAEVYKLLNPGGTYGDTFENDTDPNDGTLTLYESHGGGFEIAIVPEPATFTLFGIGLLGLAGIARRRVK